MQDYKEMYYRRIDEIKRDMEFLSENSKWLPGETIDSLLKSTIATLEVMRTLENHVHEE